MIATESRYDARRPRVSATTPVGTSKNISETVNAALTTMISKRSSPTSSKKSVLTPQISDCARVVVAPMPR